MKRLRRRLRVSRDLSRDREAALRRLVEVMRGDEPKEAAMATLVVADALEERGFRDLLEENYSLETRRGVTHLAQTGEFLDDEVWLWSRVQRAADRAERILENLRWEDRVMRGKFIGDQHVWRKAAPPGKRLKRIRIIKKGRVVARGQNLRAISNYVRVGTNYILLEKLPDGGGRLHVLFQDGARVATKFASFNIMKDWVLRRQTGRHTWWTGVPVKEFER